MKVHLTSKLGTLAAAIGLALGTTTALAQVDRPDPSAQQDEQQQQQPFGQEEQRQQEPFGQSESQTAADEQAATDEGEIDKLTEENGDISKFVDALKTTGLADELTGGTQYTVFAPTNEALDSKQGDKVEEMEHDALVELLRAHIVADDVDMTMARNLPAAQTVDGGTITLQAPAEGEDGELMVGDATAVESDIELGNLRVYAIDGVLESNPIASERSGETAIGSDDGSEFGDESDELEPEQDPDTDFGRSSPDDIR